MEPIHKTSTPPNPYLLSPPNQFQNSKKPEETPYSKLKSAGKAISFITEIGYSQNTRNNKNNSVTDINTGFTEMGSFIDNFDTKLTNYLTKQEETCLKRYKQFVDQKNFELREMQKHLDQTIGDQANSVKDCEVRRLREELAILYTKFNAMGLSYTILDKEMKKTRVNLEHSEDENKFLRVQLKTRMKESTRAQITLQSIALILRKFEENRENDNENIEQKYQKLVSFFEELNKMLEKSLQENNSLSMVADLCLSNNPKNSSTKSKQLLSLKTPEKPKIAENSYSTQKRSSSTIKNYSDDLFKKQLQNLSQRNESLEKRISSLKSQLSENILYRKELEDIFVECIEKTKKEIYKRKLKVSTLGNNLDINLVDPKIRINVTNDVTSTVRKFKDYIENMPKNDQDIKLKDFNIEDKINLVTLFVCNDKIIQYFYDLLFPKHQHNLPSSTDLFENNVTANYQTPTENASQPIIENKNTLKYSRLSQYPVNSIQKLLEDEKQSRNDNKIITKTSKSNARKHMRFKSNL